MSYLLSWLIILAIFTWNSLPDEIRTWAVELWRGTVQCIWFGDGVQQCIQRTFQWTFFPHALRLRHDHYLCSAICSRY